MNTKLCREVVLLVLELSAVDYVLAYIKSDKSSKTLVLAYRLRVSSLRLHLNWYGSAFRTFTAHATVDKTKQ